MLHSINFPGRGGHPLYSARPIAPALRLIRQFRTLLRVQHSPLQQGLHFTATINYQQNVHVLVLDSVNDAVRFKKDFSIFADPQRD